MPTPPGQSAFQLRITLDALGVDRHSDQSLVITTKDLDLVDVIVDGRPREALDTTNEKPATAAVPLVAATIEVRGYASGRFDSDV